jgi:hypothetical protein
MPGNEFSSLITGTAGVLPFVPTINVDVGMPLAAARLVSGTSTVLWGNLYDLRPIITGDDKDKIAIFQDNVFVVSGTSIDFLGTFNVSATGTSVFVSSTGGGGGGGGSSLVILDDGVFKVTGTAVDFTSNLGVVVTGSTAFVSYNGCITETCAATGFRLVGGTATINYLVHESAFYLSGSGSSRGANAIDLQKIRTNDNQVASAGNSFLIGGSSNRADATSAGVAGGSSNYSSGAESFIGGGQSNTIQGSDGAILGGISNTINANMFYGVVLGGSGNIIDASSGAVAMGHQAVAHDDGQFVQGISVNGGSTSNELQGSRHILGLRQVMVTGTWYNLETASFVDGLSIPTDSVWTFEILLVGAIAGIATKAGYRINGVIENDGGTTTLLASNVTVLYESNAALDAQVVGDNTNDKLQVQVLQSTGAPLTMQWVASILTAELNAYT